MPNRKVIGKLAAIGGIAFWSVLVIANHGLGKVSVQTPAVVVGEAGFVGCWLIAFAAGVSPVFCHPAAYRRLRARQRRHETAERIRHKSFRLTAFRRRPPSQPESRGFEVLPQSREDAGQNKHAR